MPELGLQNAERSTFTNSFFFRFKLFFFLLKTAIKETMSTQHREGLSVKPHDWCMIPAGTLMKAQKVITM